MPTSHAHPRRTDESERIKSRYATRDAHAGAPDAFAILEREDRFAAIGELLGAHFSGRSLATLTALDVGCGGGTSLQHFLTLGFETIHLVGIELMPGRAAAARDLLPENVRIIEGDAVTAPLPFDRFDAILQSMVFTSILDDDVQRGLAKRMWDLVKPGGLIVWYDFVYDNPLNKDVRGMPVSRIRTLFPDGELTTKTITLAPPIGRPAARLSPALYRALSAIPLLRSHVLASIAKPTSGNMVGAP